MDIARALEVADFERAAEASMAPQYWAYLAGGAGNGGAVRANSDAFGQVSLVPRIATEDCSSPATSRRLFGRILTMPVLLAPTSPQRLFHEDAELACARAARAAGTLMVVSTDSHFGMDQIAAAAGSQSRPSASLRANMSNASSGWRSSMVQKLSSSPWMHILPRAASAPNAQDS